MSQYKVNIDEFLSPSFRPETVANRLLRETTTARDNSVTVDPSITRLQYDSEEIIERMRDLCRKNPQLLLETTQTTNQVVEQVKSFQPFLENMTTSFEKLNRDFLVPFMRSLQLQLAGENLSRAAHLSSKLSWYLQLALQAQTQNYKCENSNTFGKSSASMLRIAQALKALSQLVAETPDLKLIKAVEQFETRRPGLQSEVIDRATASLRSYDGTGSINQLKMAALALVTLDANLPEIVRTYMKALVGTTVIQLSKCGGSIVDYDKAFEEAKQRATLASHLQAVANEMDPSNQEHFEPFWSQVGGQLDQKLRIMSVANSGAMRVMILNRSDILNRTSSVPAVKKVYEKYLDSK